jgi:hypothetical protein
MGRAFWRWARLDEQGFARRAISQDLFNVPDASGDRILIHRRNGKN